MLVLERRIGEQIIVDGDLVITVTRISNSRVKLGFEGPRERKIMRAELEDRERIGANLRRFFGVTAAESAADQDVREFAEWAGPRCSLPLRAEGRRAQQGQPERPHQATHQKTEEK